MLETEYEISPNYQSVAPLLSLDYNNLPNRIAPMKEGMLMGININTDLAQGSASYLNSYAAPVKPESAGKAAQEQTKVSENGKVVVKEEEAKGRQAAEVGAVYEKTSQKTENGKLYSIADMKKADRQAIVSQMKADQEKRMNQMTDLIHQMMSGQTRAYGLATKEESIWDVLSKGDLKASPATIKQAQEDIKEDGYWGVKQTSDRMFDFAQALAGNDPDKMKTMQEAMQKGYEKAEKTWGGKLPEISRQTLDAANKLFEDYFAAQKSEAEKADPTQIGI